MEEDDDDNSTNKDVTNINKNNGNKCNNNNENNGFVNNITFQSENNTKHTITAGPEAITTTTAPVNTSVNVNSTNKNNSSSIIVKNNNNTSTTSSDNFNVKSAEEKLSERRKSLIPMSSMEEENLRERLHLAQLRQCSAIVFNEVRYTKDTFRRMFQTKVRIIISYIEMNF